MKRILIIGASSGIGRGVAELYASSGNMVIAAGRRTELLQSLKDSYPDNVECVTLNVLSPGLEQALDDVLVSFGKVDVALISSGVGFQNPELEIDKELVTLQTNVIAFSRICYWAYKYFSERGGGHLAGISSIAGTRGLDVCPAYSASKGFEAILLESLRRKSHKEDKKIFVSTIIPGFVDTAMGQSKQAFWRSSVEKASEQIVVGLEKKRDFIFVTKRWRIIFWFLKIVPSFLFKRV